MRAQCVRADSESQLERCSEVLRKAALQGKSTCSARRTCLQWHQDMVSRIGRTEPCPFCREPNVKRAEGTTGAWASANNWRQPHAAPQDLHVCHSSDCAVSAGFSRGPTVMLQRHHGQCGARKPGLQLAAAIPHGRLATRIIPKMRQFTGSFVVRADPRQCLRDAGDVPVRAHHVCKWQRRDRCLLRQPHVEHERRPALRHPLRCRRRADALKRLVL